MKKIVRNIIRKVKKNFKIGTINYIGEYPSWELAAADCVGYDSDIIFQKAIESAQAVKNKQAVYERDTVLFYEKTYNYPLIAYINKILLEFKNCKEIVDLGGAFGSTFMQNKDLLPVDIKWKIVEQKHVVEYGKENFEDNNLTFEYPIDAVQSNMCLVCSGALQFIYNYKEYLDIIFQKKFENIIIERTPFSNKSWIWIEIVKEPIYNASYPSYVFDETEFVNYFISNNYTLIDTFESLVDGKIEFNNKIVTWKSMIFKRNR